MVQIEFAIDPCEPTEGSKPPTTVESVIGKTAFNEVLLNLVEHCPQIV